MNVLLIDQFGRTTGRDTLALAELMNKNSDINMQVLLSDNTEIPKERKYTVKIMRGFHGAYEGSYLNKSIHYLKSLREIKQYIKQNDIDIVHLQWFSLPWIEWIYVGALRKMTKVVITIHDIIPFDNRPFEMQSLDRIYREANALCIHTESGKKLFAKNYKSETPIHIVTQGFCNKSDYQRIDNIEAKKHFGIPEDAVVFLYYGTIRSSKGLDKLIRAIHDAHNKNSNIYLLAAGAFQKVNEEEYRNLVDEKLEPGYSTVNFGFVAQEEERWYFSAADVLCLPYLEVTQSGVAQLGLMYELPIIAADVGELCDICKNNVNGCMVDAGNIENLAKQIELIAADKELRIRYSKESRRMGESEFSLELKADRIVGIYRNV